MLQDQRQVLGLVQRELAGDLGASVGDLLLHPGRRLDLAVENDGQPLISPVICAVSAILP